MTAHYVRDAVSFSHRAYAPTCTPRHCQPDEVVILDQLLTEAGHAIGQTLLCLRLKRRTSPSINVGVFGFNLGTINTVFNTQVLH